MRDGPIIAMGRMPSNEVKSAISGLPAELQVAVLQAWRLLQPVANHLVAEQVAHQVVAEMQQIELQAGCDDFELSWDCDTVDFTTFQIASPLPDILAASYKDLNLVAAVACVCKDWRASCDAWRAGVQSLEVLNCTQRTLRTITGLSYRSLMSVRLSSCSPFKKEELLDHCSGLCTRCPLLTHLDVIKVQLESKSCEAAMTLADRDAMLLEFPRLRNLYLDVVVNYKLAMMPGENLIYFKSKLSTKFIKMMTAFCERQRLSQHDVYFEYRKQRVHAEDSLYDLGVHVADLETTETPSPVVGEPLRVSFHGTESRFFSA